MSHVTVVISGVLDSMSREEMTEYIVRHGGKVVKSITKSLTHLMTDVEGTVGQSKLQKCNSCRVPVVGEDYFFDLVRTRPI